MIAFLSYFFSPNIAEASALGNLMFRINRYLINPAILLMFAIAVVMFIVGLAEFMAQKDNAEAVEKGKRHMVWGIIGIFIMVAVFFIMRVIINVLGVSLPDEVALPLNP